MLICVQQTPLSALFSSCLYINLAFFRGVIDTLNTGNSGVAGLYYINSKLKVYMKQSSKTISWYMRTIRFFNHSFRSVRVRIFVTFILLGVISVAVVGILLLAYVSQNTRQEYLNANKLTLINLSNVIDVSLIDNIDTIFQNYTSNQDNYETLSKLVFEPLEGNHAMIVRINRLLRKTITNASYYNQIEDVLIFYPDKELVVSGMGMKYLAGSDALEELVVIDASFPLYSRISFYSRLYSYDAAKSYISFVYRFPYHTSEEHALIFVMLREEFLDGIFAQAGIKDEVHNFAVLDIHSQPVYLGNTFQKNLELLDDPQILTAPLKNGWKVLKYVDFDSFQNRIWVVRKVFILVLSIAVALAVLLSVFFSKRIYTPLGRIVGRIRGSDEFEAARKNEYTLIEDEFTDLTTKVDDLETTVQKNTPAIKANFVRDIFAGRIRLRETLVSRSGLFNMRWDHDLYRCIVFQLNKKAVEDLESHEGHFALYYFIDDIERVFSAAHGADIMAVEYDTNLVSAVIGYEKRFESSLDPSIGQVLNETGTNLEMKTTAFIGTAVEDPLSLDSSYTHALTTVGYEYVLTNRSIIYYENIVSRENSKSTIDPNRINQFEDIVRRHDEASLKEFLSSTHRLMISGDYSIDECHRFSQEMRQKIQNYANEIFCTLELPMEEDNIVDLIDLTLLHAERALFNYLKRKESNGYGPTITAICQYINEHLGELLSLDVIADLFNIPVSSLSRSFKKVIGENFLSYVNERRLEHAKYLLRETEDNVKDVAGQCGFNSDSYFIYQFKSRFGYTPNTYQKLSRAKTVPADMK